MPAFIYFLYDEEKMTFFDILSFLHLTFLAQKYIISTYSYGDLAQLVEHTAHIRDVNGSIPLVAKKASSKGKLFLF